MKVVVVEDDMLLSRHYERILLEANHEVYRATHGPAAIELIDEVTPEALVVDMLLTGSTVMPLLHELRSHDDLARIPIVMITNTADDLSLDVLKPYGVQRLLNKTTFEPTDLLVAIRSIAK